VTLETFNLLLAVGGGFTVPAVVGAVGTYLVRRQDPGIAAEMKRDLLGTSEPVDLQGRARDERIPA
jgi:hypothetical protein